MHGTRTIRFTRAAAAAAVVVLVVPAGTSAALVAPAVAQAPAPATITLAPPSGPSGTTFTITITAAGCPDGMAMQYEIVREEDIGARGAVWAPSGPLTDHGDGTWTGTETAETGDVGIQVPCLDNLTAEFDTTTGFIDFTPQGFGSNGDGIKGTDCTPGATAAVVITWEGGTRTLSATADGNGDWFIAMPKDLYGQPMRVSASCGDKVYAPIRTEQDVPTTTTPATTAPTTTTPTTTASTTAAVPNAVAPAATPVRARARYTG